MGCGSKRCPYFFYLHPNVEKKNITSIQNSNMYIALIYIHSLKQKTYLHNSEMAATLRSDGTFGILNIMLCGILYMNTIVNACLYFSNQNWKTVLYVKQRQVDFSQKIQFYWSYCSQWRIHLKGGIDWTSYWVGYASSGLLSCLCSWDLPLRYIIILPHDIWLIHSMSMGL